MAENVTDIKNGAMEIVVDDGSVKVPIRNKSGEEIGVFYFHPTDVGIINRYNQMIDKFDDIVAPLEHVNIAADGTAEAGEGNDTTDGAAALLEAEKRLYEAVDFMFGGNMSEAFFGTMHPFSPVKGRFYCESAIEAVGNFISKQFDRETKAVKQRTARYTRGYKTGKHAAGKK